MTTPALDVEAIRARHERWAAAGLPVSADRRALLAEVDRLTPARIATVQDSADLPVGTIVRSAAGTIACRYDQQQGVVFGIAQPFAWIGLALPLAVLWRPEVDR